MRLLSLNTWGGRAGRDGLLDFYARHQDADIICLQEVWSAPYDHLEGKEAGGTKLNHERIMVYALREISELLNSHTAYFRPHLGDHYGLLTLVKKELAVLEEGDVFVYKKRGHVPPGDVGHHARNIQYMTLTTPSGPRTIINFHGLWNGQGKGDSEDRLNQSDNIVAFTRTLKNPYILCGDFNLLPDTESVKKFEAAGMRNLITEYGITSTRTSHYKKLEKFADYTFVSDGIEVKDFQILPDEVSDHSPMQLEFE